MAALIPMQAAQQTPPITQSPSQDWMVSPDGQLLKAASTPPTVAPLQQIKPFATTIRPLPLPALNCHQAMMEHWNTNGRNPQVLKILKEISTFKN